MISSQILEQQIEAVIHAHIAACHVAVRAAVERAFASAKSEPISRQRPTKLSSKRAQRRTPEELAALGERFYSAVCDKPGETMAVLSSQIGATSQQLHLPVLRLKRAGRVRSVGSRAHTRYFPLVGDAKAGKEARS